MPKKLAVLEPEENENEIDDTPPETVEHERKIDRFFNEFLEINDYVIKLYKRDGKKWTQLTEYYGERPDIINDIQKIYGGGTYQLYAATIQADGKTSLLDTVTFNLADPVGGVKTSPEKNSDPEIELLKRMAMYKEIIGGGSQFDPSKFLEIMNQNTMMIMQAQQKSEERFNSMMIEIVRNNNKQQNGIDDFLKMFELAKNMIPDNNDNQNILSNLIPFAPALNSVIQSQLVKENKPAPIPAAIPAPQKRIEMSIDEIKNLITDDLKKAITPENKEKVIEGIYKKLKGHASKENIKQAIE